MSGPPIIAGEGETLRLERWTEARIVRLLPGTVEHPHRWVVAVDGTAEEFVVETDWADPAPEVGMVFRWR